MIRILRALVGNFVTLLTLPLVLVSRVLQRPKARWLEVWIRPSVHEIEPRRTLLARVLGDAFHPRGTSLHRLRRLAEHAGRDPRVEGVLFVIPPLAAGWAASQGLREIVEALGKAGKRTVVHLPRGGGHRELFVASAAERVVVSPRATLFLPGVGVASLYVKPLLEKLGIEVERFRRSEFKTAYETAEREAMSEPQRAQLGAIVEAVDRELRAALLRKVGDEARVRALFDEAMVTPERAMELGLVDAKLYEDELPSYLGLHLPKERTLGGGTYLAYHERKLFRPMRRRPYTAVVEVHGAIVDQGAPGRDAAAIIGAIRRASRDRRAAGVVLHVRSPGGSALASDLIHREVEALARKKPVVAFFDEVAASGGYYVAAPAASIVARPLAITGSIGVVMARPTIATLLEKLGVRREAIVAAPHADLLAPGRPLADGEREILEREIDSFYRGFVEIVAAGRNRSPDVIEPLARGRVYVASEAQAVGLVDRLGGFDVALGEVERLVRERTGKAISLEPLSVPGRPGLPPPPEPSVPRALAALGAPEALTDLARVALAGDRVLYFEPEVPEVR